MELFKDDISISASEEEEAEEEECPKSCEAEQRKKISNNVDLIDAPPAEIYPIKEDSPSAPNLKEGEMISPKKKK